MTVTLGGTGPVIPQFQSNSKTERLWREKIKLERGKIVAEVSVSFLLPQNPPNKNT